MLSQVAANTLFSWLGFVSRLDIGAYRISELIIRDTEDCAITDAGIVERTPL
jgi:hypothetical protein